jgi:hypothetical protein
MPAVISQAAWCSMQKRDAGRAASRSSGIGRPQASQEP